MSGVQGFREDPDKRNFKGVGSDILPRETSPVLDVDVTIRWLGVGLRSTWGRVPTVVVRLFPEDPRKGPEFDVGPDIVLSRLRSTGGTVVDQVSGVTLSPASYLSVSQVCTSLGSTRRNQFSGLERLGVDE